MKQNDGSTASTELLDLHRRDIDRIDKTILALLNERMRVGVTIGELKRAQSQAIRSTAREAEVLASVRRSATGLLAPESAERIFSAIIAETVTVQERNVA